MIELNSLQDIIKKEMNDLILHLDKYEVKSWSDYLKKNYKLINNGDKKGVKNLIETQGGMGGFIDFVIRQLNVHRIKKENFANLEIMHLGNLVFNSAEKLKN